MSGEYLLEAVRDALAILETATGLDADALFGERVLGELTHLAREAAHATGVLEGAGVALDLTSWRCRPSWDCAASGRAS